MFAQEVSVEARPELTNVLRSMFEKTMKELRDRRPRDDHLEGLEKPVKSVNSLADMMNQDRERRFDTRRLCCVLPPWNFVQSN